jgi:phospholipase C
MLTGWIGNDGRGGGPVISNARTGTNTAVPGTPFDALFDTLRADVAQNRLPQVSWIVAPEAFSEHGNWPSNYGAWYVSQVLDAPTSNPEVWSKTALFIVYDENGGLFDHVVPPTPARSAAEGA